MNQNHEILELIKVRFWGMPKPYTFKTNGNKYKYQQKVIAKTDRGLAVGFVNSLPFQIKSDPLAYEPIIREANSIDIDNFEKGVKKGLALKSEMFELISKFNLNMTVSHVCPVNDSTKFVIYFTANSKVDFRELVRDLKTKGWTIELRHINKHQQMEALGIFAGCAHSTSYYLYTANKFQK